MKILIKKTIVDGLYTIEIRTIPTTIEKDLFEKFGEPTINIDGALNFQNIKKIYSDTPIILTDTDSAVIITIKNTIVTAITDAMTTLRESDTDFIGDESLEI